jgi:hypothetical protein
MDGNSEINGTGVLFTAFGGRLKVRQMTLDRIKSPGADEDMDYLGGVLDSNGYDIGKLTWEELVEACDTLPDTPVLFYMPVFAGIVADYADNGSYDHSKTYGKATERQSDNH